VNWEQFKRQLGREIDDYLADLREIRADLKSIEGWIALGLLVAAVLMTGAWLIVSLGFNPANDHVLSFMYKFGLRSCREVSNFNGVILFINLFMVLFLSAVSLGNVINMMKRANQKLPREPRDLIISSSLMLACGIGGIIFMLKIC
jgi:hypothetical protein